MKDLLILLSIGIIFIDLICFLFTMEDRKWYHWLPFGALISTIIYVLKYRD